jgi:hypothetical protein
MKGAEIVMCNFDEPTTKAFKDKFPLHFFNVKEDNESHSEIDSEDEVDSNKEAYQVPKKKSKLICITFNLH